LYGSDQLRAAIETGTTADLVKGWGADQEAFRRLRTPYLLY